ncbi:hypothetical protein Gotri_015093 [Gossypium trilobum]|uniref:Uncharacterized protein n=1 Tax=Gossypium trilobum TaxID=34281 RepID=A0A7J9DZ83_9ROSI|nr:hypothetical protein [Gossypium trilobum]
MKNQNWWLHSTTAITGASVAAIQISTINLRDQTYENWPIFHYQHINMWNNRYDFLPTRKLIVIPELAYDSKHLHPHTSKPRLAPLNLRTANAGLS